MKEVLSIEIKIDTEKTVEQIGMQMLKIIENLCNRSAENIIKGKSFGAENFIRDSFVQKNLMQYNRLINLIESVKPLDKETEKNKAAGFEKRKEQPLSELFLRFSVAIGQTESIGEILSVFHDFVPVLVHRMRVEGIIKEGGENE